MAVCVGDVAYYRHKDTRQAGQVLLHVSVNNVPHTLTSSWQRLDGQGCDAGAPSSCFIAKDNLELLRTEQLETAVVYNNSNGHVVVLNPQEYRRT